jgi:multidrug resistance efflux pump
MNGGRRTIAVDEAAIARMRHTIRASTVLYRAPPIVLRGPTYMIFVIVFAALVYSFWATKDELVVAPLELQRESTTVQAIGSGMVVDLLTEENALIDAGDPIAVVQEQIRAITNPEQESLLSERRELEKNLDKAVKDYDHEVRQLELQLDDLTTGRSTRVAGLDKQIQQIRSTIGTAQRKIDTAYRQLGTARNDLNVKEQLFASRDITVSEIEQAREKVALLERSVLDGQAEKQQLQLELSKAQGERDKVASLQEEQRIAGDIQKLQANKERDIKDYNERIADVTKRLEESETLIRGVDIEGKVARYKSNFDGVVTAIHVTRGQLIDAGTQIATIVKATAPLEARMLIENKDIGRLRHGQLVKIKYYAYPYQDYGVAEGTITDIATKPGVDGDSPDSRYLVKAALHQETIKRKNEREKRLEIGLAGVAEVKTGEKRLIELVFAPLSKFFNEPEEGEGASGAQDLAFGQGGNRGATR